MEDVPSVHYLGHGAAAAAQFLFIAVALPFIPVLILNIPPAPVLALMAATFLIEYGAAPVGIGLGLHPLFVFFTLCCIAAGVTLLLFDVVDVLDEHSGRVGGFLRRSAERARQSPVLSRYGIYGLVPCVMTLGFYVCPPVACLCGWNRDASVRLIMAGYGAISAATILLTLGVFDIFLR